MLRPGRPPALPDWRRQ